MRAKIVVLCVSVVLASGAGLFLALRGAEAETESLSDKAKELLEYVATDASLNLRLCALEEFRKLKDKDIESELEKLAEGKNRVLAVYSCTALGHRKTSSSKSKLKTILEDSNIDKEVRIGALSAIAWHWKDKDDLSYLKDKSKNDSKLYSQYLWLEKKVHGK